MHPAVQDHSVELTELCKKFGVRRLALFGSAARDDFNVDLSDVDLIVEFSDTTSPGYADRYLDFALAAERLLGRRVDLITVRSIVNPIFEQTVRRDRVELYAA
jgi:predicted nucleotidyltransferase